MAGAETRRVILAGAESAKHLALLGFVSEQKENKKKEKSEKKTK